MNKEQKLRNGSSVINDRPLYNSRIIDTYLKLVKRRYSYVNIGELLDYATMKPYEVADEGHWFTQEQVDLFYEKLVKMTGNENIAREAGQYGASPDALGVMRQYALGLVGPSSTFALLKQATENFVKSSVYESRKISSNKVEITVTPKDGCREKLFQCENRIGFFEAIVKMFNYKIREINHPECMFRGDKVCRYVISWDNTVSALWKKIQYFTVLLISVTNLILFIAYPLITLTKILPLSICVALFASLIAEHMENKDLRTAVENLQHSTIGLLSQITVNYNNALLTNEIGQAIGKHTDVDEVLGNVTSILEKRLDYDRGLILLASADKTKLIFRNGFGYTDVQSQVLRKTVFHLDRPQSKGVFVLCFREQKPFLINDLNEIESDLSQRSLAFAKRMGTRSFICCPIICDEKSIGILAVDNVKSKKPLIQSDMSLLMGISHVIGISIRNASLLEAKLMQFKSMLQVLAASIDARDNLTAGHSAKVTEYVLGICNELGLAREYTEMIRVASLLHDYGKIGVPDSILKKAGRLTSEEHDIVKAHSAKTREILEQINFEGIYCQVPEIAGSHHEKVDGTGYPGGLKGDDIPLGAKIIAVADFFEAVTSKRHYREPMPVDVAIQLLHDGKGKHFEEQIVDAFIRHLEETELLRQDEFDGKLVYMNRMPKRVSCSFPVTVNIQDAPLSGSCVNISPKGMYVVGDFDVEEGSEVGLSFEFPNSPSTPVDVRGRVAWVIKGKEKQKSALPAGFGLEFMEASMAEEAMQAVLGVCDSGEWLFGGGKPIDGAS
jgi:HD-GYP domain-containing protein (c-di-GMP phosphodiesterase class II)